VFYFPLSAFRFLSQPFHAVCSFQSWIIKHVVDEFSASFGLHQTYIPENAQVLRGNGLIKLQCTENVVNAEGIIVVDQTDHTQTQGMGKSTHHFARELELLAIKIGFGLIHGVVLGKVWKVTVMQSANCIPWQMCLFNI